MTEQNLGVAKMTVTQMVDQLAQAYISIINSDMADTSGSVCDEDIGRVYAEIYSACEQFRGTLNGKLGFFDVDETEPIPFESAEDILSIIPYGDGGTDFTSVFDYVRDSYIDVYQSCIIIFTEGQGSYPEEADTLGIPTLWILDNQEFTPPFGKTVRLSKNNNYELKQLGGSN